MQLSATSFEVADSARQNHVPALSDQLYNSTDQAEDIENMFQDIDQEDDKKVDAVLFNELNELGVQANAKEIDNQTNRLLNRNENLSHEDQIKGFLTNLDKEKSSPEILKILIEKFEREPAVKTWVENWRNFLKLHELASSKPESERKDIQQIIFSADFSSETAFGEALKEVASSESLSAQTKLEITQEFNGSDIVTVDGLDAGLQHLESRKKSAENLLRTQQNQQADLGNEIEDLKSELDSLQTESPKRKALEKEIALKKESLEQIETDIVLLEEEANKDVAFALRSGFDVALDPNGSRRIKLSADYFSLKLPNHSLPFTSLKNLRSINLAFVVAPLRKSFIADTLFSPNLVNGETPTKKQRALGHLILSSLGFNDSEILLEKDVKQLNIDLERLAFSPLGKTGQERLVELGIYDHVSQKVDDKKLQSALACIKENRDDKQEILIGKIQNI